MNHDETSVEGPVISGQHKSSEDNDLLVAVNILSDRVKELTVELTVSKQQARRTRVLSIAVITMMLVGLVMGYNYTRDIASAVQASDDTQVQQCENANSVRKANILLWDQIIGLSLSNPDTDTKTRVGLVALQDWIRVLYRPRDCSRLDKVYDNPPPPDFKKIMGQK